MKTQTLQRDDDDDDRREPFLLDGQKISVPMVMMDNKGVPMPVAFDASAHRPGYRLGNRSAAVAALDERIRSESERWRDPDRERAAQLARDEVFGADRVNRHWPRPTPGDPSDMRYLRPVDLSEAERRREAAYQDKVRRDSDRWKTAR